MKRIHTRHHRSDRETDLHGELLDAFRSCPIPDGELLDNLALFMRRQNLSRLLFLNDLYRRIVDRHGVVMEFGTRWGHNLAVLASLRGIYEPFNHSRKIIGFDTFEGFLSPHEKDGETTSGDYAVTEGYETYLERVMALHEQFSPLSHIRKFDVLKGDAVQRVREYLDAHPETIVALAWFDMDLYEPTLACLRAIAPHLARGSVVGFDQLNRADFPGETVALREFIDLREVTIRRSPYSSQQSYIVIE